MTKPTPIDCAEALRLLSEYLDDELKETARELVASHLHVCRSCFSRAEFEMKITRQLKEIGRGRVRPEFEQRIQLLVSEFASAPADTPNHE